jgi:uncharacterized protein
MTEPHDLAAASTPAKKPTFDPAPMIALELALPLAAVRVVAELLEGGATVPFIARYRKEQTQGLDEVQIRTIEEKRAYYIEVAERRVAILTEIESQGKLTPELRKTLENCWVKATLEDLYLPYKPKRRTRAMIAKERGLEPLALKILGMEAGNPEAEALAFVDAAKEVADVKAALAGAKDIVAEIVAEDADVRGLVRQTFEQEGVVECKKADDSTAPTKFEIYYDFQEKVATIPSHRYLAIRRGETENVLRGKIVVDELALAGRIAEKRGVRGAATQNLTFTNLYRDAIGEATRRLIVPSIESDVRIDMKLKADRDAVQIFAENLRKLLLAAPLGRRVVLGVDPGQRTGCKCVVVDDTGKLLEYTLINLVTGSAAVAHAEKTIVELAKKYNFYAVAVGNGTHGRETYDFVRDVLKKAGHKDAVVVSVSESGASVYSASDVAREEFPDLDLTVRGAISIARRLQDPLAELVKVDPKAIGVGQYQHDVFQPLLKRKLEEVIESCVNTVGVELNTASAPLLAKVAGIGPTLAKRIVKHREETGPFPSRDALKKVTGLGPKTYEQAAGFVRVRNGAHPLDGSAVHPERYALVEKIASDAGIPLTEFVGNEKAVKSIRWNSYVSADVGLPTLEDIQKELMKPGRDPRDAFEPPAFRDDVRTMEDLKQDMVLEGVVTNVTAFGAFVDIGVHQDGLVHISQLSDRFVSDPHQVVKVGEKLSVRVLEVDLVRKRIALTAKSGVTAKSEGIAPQAPRGPNDRGGRPPQGRPQNQAKMPAQKAFENNPFAALKGLTLKN